MTTRLAEGNAGSQFDEAWSGSLNAAVAAGVILFEAQRAVMNDK